MLPPRFPKSGIRAKGRSHAVKAIGKGEATFGPFTGARTGRKGQPHVAKATGCSAVAWGQVAMCNRDDSR
ncbi:hypothetical protein GW17_00030273 [Ensete ventricosum]|nr:hypothetical protein GW17_00030273 [Ensete ventricosum]RZR79083.1 hypothetical protein BHM03_00004654 [Ensete ventricosum]